MARGSGRAIRLPTRCREPHRVLTRTFDPELTPGARNAVRVCLNIQPHERVTVVTDRACEEIAASLVQEVEAVGAPHEAFVLEDEAPRPLTGLPATVAASMEQSQVSIFAVQVQPNELTSRMELTGIVNRRRMRHAHMVNITAQIMREGMRADYLKVDRLSQKVIEMVRVAKTVRATTPGGSDFTATLNPDYRWLKTSGLISPDKWGNLPGGEIFTFPFNSNGRFVVDGVVGDYLCQKYGDIGATPLTIDIKDNRIAGLSCANKELLEEFDRYCHTDENSNRVGEFAIGTNLACTRIIGHILQDEKLPGIHIAFGHPYSEHTGQTWKSTTHIDCVGRFFDIWLDDEQVMAKGKFLI